MYSRSVKLLSLRMRIEPMDEKSFRPERSSASEVRRVNGSIETDPTNEWTWFASEFCTELPPASVGFHPSEDYHRSTDLPPFPNPFTLCEQNGSLQAFESSSSSLDFDMVPYIAPFCTFSTSLGLPLSNVLVTPPSTPQKVNPHYEVAVEPQSPAMTEPKNDNATEIPQEEEEAIAEPQQETKKRSPKRKANETQDEVVINDRSVRRRRLENSTYDSDSDTKVPSKSTTKKSKAPVESKPQRKKVSRKGRKTSKSSTKSSRKAPQGQSSFKITGEDAPDVAPLKKNDNNKLVYHCPYCPKTFSITTNIRAHILTHTDIRPYACDVCDKRFNHPTNLRLHMATHASVRPFPCPQCTSSFTTAGNMRRHVVAVHSR